VSKRNCTVWLVRPVNVLAMLALVADSVPLRKPPKVKMADRPECSSVSFRVRT
jgi:hypothetical protein